MRMHPPGYLKEAESLCRRKGILLVADEIQTGMGRTGAFLSSGRFGIAPDVVTLAKGIANGLPLGAVVARDEVAARNTELAATLESLQASRRQVELLEQLKGELSKFVPDAVKALLERDPNATELEKRTEIPTGLEIDLWDEEFRSKP